MRPRRQYHGLMLTVLLLSAATTSGVLSADTGAALKGDATRGQALFNGKGFATTAMAATA